MDLIPFPKPSNYWITRAGQIVIAPQTDEVYKKLICPEGGILADQMGLG